VSTMAAPLTMSTGLYKVRTQATYRSRYQLIINFTLQSRSTSPSCSPDDEVIELVATSVVGPSAKWRSTSFEVRSVRHDGLDLLTLSSSHFDPNRSLRWH